MQKIILFIFLVLLTGCSKKDPVYDIMEIKEMIMKRDPLAVEVILDQENKRLPCSNYGEGCAEGTGKRFSIRGIELITIGFKDQNSAFKEAQSTGQYYARNWLFDDVADEPILVHFVEEVFGARRPLNTEASHPKDYQFKGTLKK